MMLSQQRTGRQASHPEPDPQVRITTSASNAAILLESLMEITWRIGSGQSNGIGDAGQPPYGFSVEGERLVDDQIAPHIVLVCLDGDIDATLTFTYDQALAYLRERAEHWEADPLEAIDCATATVEQLSAIYATDHDPETTWVEIVAIESWFGSRGWKSLI